MKKTILFSVLLATLLYTTAGAVVYRPGLIQAKFNISDDRTSDIMSVTNAERVLGTMMADVVATENNFSSLANSYSNILTGTIWSWNKTQTTFGYAGEMFFEGGVTYRFGKQFDDIAVLTVADSVILDNSKYGDFVTGTFVAPSSGWYQVDFRFADGVGGKGPTGGTWGSDLGVAWNTNGVATLAPKTDWSHIIDPGDMSLLRIVSTEPSYAAVSNMLNIGGGYVDVTLVYTNLPAPVTVFAVADFIDRGEGNFSAWSQKAEVGTIPAGSGTIQASVPFDPSKPYARIVLQCRDTVEASFEDWLDVVNLFDAETASGPTFTQTVTPIYTNALFALQVASIKSAAPARFSILVSPNSDYSAPVFNSPVGDTVSADGDTVTYNVTGLQPDTLYYAKVALSGNDVTTEKAMTFLTGLPVAPELSVTYDPVTIEVDKAKFGLKVVSLGTKKADVYFDLSDTADFANCTTREIRLGATAPFSENVEEAIPSDRATYGRVRVVNDWDFSTTSETMFFAMGPIFTVEKDGAFLSPVFSATLLGVGRIGTKVTKITLSIYDNADLIGSPVFTQDYPQDIGTFPTTVRMLQARGLAASTTYYARLTAANDENLENFSDVISFITPAAGDNIWANTSSDIDDPASYVYVWGKPASNKILHFETPPVFSPVINRDTEMPVLSFGFGATNAVDKTVNDGFNVCGYEITGTGRLTFNAESPFVSRTSGTNTICNPILFNRGNNQNLKLSFSNGDIALAGPLSTPAGGEINVMLQSYGNVHAQGDTAGMNIKQLTLGESGTLFIENQNAFTNAMKIFFENGWGAHRQTRNDSGAPLLFATTNIAITTGWSCPRIDFHGDPFVFDNATFFFGLRAEDNILNADMLVKDMIVRAHTGNSRFIKQGTGLFTLTDTMSWYDNTIKNFARVDVGCFFPMTDAAWNPDRMIFIQGGTIGLNEDYYPSLTATNLHKVLGLGNNKTWGYTAFGGDKIVCYENDPSFILTNVSQSGTASLYTDTTTVSPYDSTKTLSSYYAWPQNFLFGHRSPSVDGTVIFRNSLYQSANTGGLTCFESTNHHVAARMEGKIGLAYAIQSWSFSGNKYGGYLALESDNTEFTGGVEIKDNGNLLVNGTHYARSFVVRANSGLGGMGNVSSRDGVTIEANGALFGGEYGKGGCLTVDGKLNMAANSILRVEVPDEKDAPVGYVKLANTNSVNELKLTAPIKVMVDASLKSPCRRVVKVMDWSDAVYKDGAIPTREMFTPVYGEGTNVRSSRLYVEGDALYISYVLDNVPPGSTIIIR